MSLLREDHTAQINLASTLRGTRFKYYFPGALVPNRCPRWRWVRERAARDSFEYLAYCYSLRARVAGGADDIDFLVRLATVTLTAAHVL